MRLLQTTALASALLAGFNSALVCPVRAQESVAANHSPRFFADESALKVGIRALANLAVDYL